MTVNALSMNWPSIIARIRVFSVTLPAMTEAFLNGGRMTVNALYGWGVLMTTALYMMILIINMGLDLPETRTLESMTL